MLFLSTAIAPIVKDFSQSSGVGRSRQMTHSYSWAHGWIRNQQGCRWSWSSYRQTYTAPSMSIRNRSGSRCQRALGSAKHFWSRRDQPGAGLELCHVEPASVMSEQQLERKLKLPHGIAGRQSRDLAECGSTKVI